MISWTTATDRFLRLFGLARVRSDERVKVENRALVYRVNQLLYDSDIYNTSANGGALEDVLSAYIGSGYQNVNVYKIFPFFLPFKEIVDTYQHVMPGTWGNGVSVADEVDGKPVNPRILDPLRTVWRDSNLDSEKGKIIRWCANFGTVGIRIVTLPESTASPAQVMIAADHPERLHNFEKDDRGNVTAVALKYNKPMNFGTLADPDWQSVEVLEEFTKDGLSVRFDGVEQLEDAQRVNNYGFCPYVVMVHEDNGTNYGDWCYRGSESVVHRINWRISRQDTSIDRHQFPRWFGAGSGDKPDTVDMGDTKMSWVKLHPDSPTPLLQAIVPTIDQGAAQNFHQDLRDMLRGRQPQLNLNDVKLMGNISGEALAQVLKPTEKVILDVRPRYLHGITRALQMAVSAGISENLWDVGTGTGPEAADRAYRDGLESFAFTPMPALPQTPAQIEAQAKAEVAEKREKFALAQSASKLIGDRVEVLQLAGYKLDEAKRLAATAPVEQTGNGQPQNGNGQLPAVSPRIAAILARIAKPQ